VTQRRIRARGMSQKLDFRYDRRNPHLRTSAPPHLRAEQQRNKAGLPLPPLPPLSDQPAIRRSRVAVVNVSGAEAQRIQQSATSSRLRFARFVRLKLASKLGRTATATAMAMAMAVAMMPMVGADESPL
jgi:hypothetical protein